MQSWQSSHPNAPSFTQAGWSHLRSVLRPGLIQDPAQPLEHQFFEGVCLLTGTLALALVIPLHPYPSESAWVDGGIFLFGLASLAIGWAAHRGICLKRTMLVALLVFLDLLWFPCGGSQGSISFFFFPAAVFLVTFFERGFRYSGLALLVINVLGLYLAETAWPLWAQPFQGPVDRLADHATGFLISLFCCVLMVRGIEEGLRRGHEQAPSPPPGPGRDLQPADSGDTMTPAGPQVNFRVGRVGPGRGSSSFWREGTLSGTQGDQGQWLGWVGGNHAMSEHRQAEQTLRESEERYRTQFHLASEGIITLSPEGEVLEVNEAFARMHGYSQAEMLTMSLKDLDTPGSAAGIPERMRRLFAGEPLTFEVEHYHRDGHVFSLEVAASLIFTHGKPTLLCFHRDISERRRLEEERQRQEAEQSRNAKMQSLGRLAGGVAHDMNNVLCAILGLATIHQEQAPEGTQLQKDMETIAKACERGGSMVKGLLGFARETIPDERLLDLNLLLREEAALLERTALQRVTLELDLAADLPPILGDPAALSHCLMNLCMNALDAIPERGTITLRTRNEGPGTVLLEVADTGEGMPQEVIDKAMDPFFTTKPIGKGTGLGLPMVYGTVTAHKGTIHIHSEPGRGTQVRIRFPACLPKHEDLQPPGAWDPMTSRASLQVLLIDDDELIRGSVLSILEALGHRPVAASGGEDGLARLATGPSPDLVILDMNMPGMDGSETLKRIRGLNPAVPVLIATGRVNQAAQDLVDAFPHVRLLAKPFGLKELEQQLQGLATTS